MLDTLALVGPREHVSGAAPVSLGIGHFEGLLVWLLLEENLEKRDTMVSNGKAKARSHNGGLAVSVGKGVISTVHSVAELDKVILIERYVLLQF